jgi:hypothetical protein
MIRPLNRVLVKGVLIGSLATLIASLYILFYFNKIVDFSDGKGWSGWLLNLLSYYMLLSIGISLVHFVFIEKVGKNMGQKWKSFLFSVFLILMSLILVFSILLMNDPVFSTDDAQLMVDFFKGFLMPLAFIPMLTWYSIQSFYSI